MEKSKVIIDGTKRQLFKLVYKNWHHHIPNEFRKIMIADSLNKSIEIQKHNIQKLKIHGYLIMESNMILYVEEIGEHTEVWEQFHDCFNATFKACLEEKEQNGEMINVDYGGGIASFFLMQKLYDKNLVLLLTGRKVNKAYHDPNLLRWKALLKQTKYCSIIDYSGGISPVMVNKFTDNAT